MLQRKLIQHIQSHEQLMNDLFLVRDLRLPNGYIAAGYIRNYIWDIQHGFEASGRHNDIDVVYFDSTNCAKEIDTELEDKLIRTTGNTKWSVKNQARMHIRNGDTVPYTSIDDALGRWPETATAVGVQADFNGNIQVINPYGLEDLFQMIVRRSPLFADRDYYLNRIAKKNWKEHWPLLTIMDD